MTRTSIPFRWKRIGIYLGPIKGNATHCWTDNNRIRKSLSMKKFQKDTRNKDNGITFWMAMKPTYNMQAYSKCIETWNPWVKLIYIYRAGPSLQTQAPRLQFCPKAGLPLQTQEPRLQFYKGWIGAVPSRCFLHPALSFESEQTLKDLKKFPGAPTRWWGVDLANWALRTSPKFTTGVKY